MQKKLVDLFEEKVANIPTENKAYYKINPSERHAFKKAIQEAFPDLRYRDINGLISIDDFAVKVETELQKREEFFSKALDLIRKVTGHPEYTFDSVLLEEFKPQHQTGNKRLSEEANYFIRCQKVYNTLSRKMYTKVVFHPSAPALERVNSLRELIDVYYRKGRF